MPQTLVFLHRLRYVLSVPLSLTNSPIHSIFLLGDSNIQTLVFLHRLSIFLLRVSTTMVCGNAGGNEEPRTWVQKRILLARQ